MPAAALLPLIATGWMSAGTAAVPSSVVDAAQAAMEQATALIAADQVTVTIFDVNHPSTHAFTLGRDGSADEATLQRIRALFQCKRTHRQHSVDRGLLVMLADVGATWPGHTIEYVSAFRALDERSSRHRQGRAFDFRIRGVPTTEVRDYVWTHHKEVGVGWYPKSNFVHMDHRPGDRDYAWTDIDGREHGNPYWSTAARAGTPKPPRPTRGAGS